VVIEYVTITFYPSYRRSNCSWALAFGLCYLFVVALHLGAFVLKGEGGAARAIFGVAPFNPTSPMAYVDLEA